MRSSDQLLFSSEVSCRDSRGMGYHTRFFVLEMLIIYSGGKYMKVVLIKSPKLLSGILRMIFGIKKQNI